MKMRKGFTIIEVIFMMSILAIILPTLPLLVMKSSDAIKEIKDTEYYSNGFTSTILTINKLWDENNTDDIETSGKYYVLETDATTNDNNLLNCINNYRQGHYQAKNRRKCTTEGKTASTLGLDTGETYTNGEIDDIDDFDVTEYRIIPENKLTPEFETEVSNANTSGEDDWVWLKQILAEPVDENDIDASVTVIANKYSITEDLARKWVIIMPTLKVSTVINYIDYKKPSADDIDTSILNNSGNKTDIKRVTVILTDLTDKNRDTRKEIRYYYYATNIGTDIPLVKVND
jgi:type II secretory pathway pseudopilin PulG